MIKLTDVDDYVKISYIERNESGGLTLYYANEHMIDIHQDQILQIAAKILGVENETSSN